MIKHALTRSAHAVGLGVFISCLLSFFSPTVFSQEKLDPSDYLQQLQDAALKQNYRGTFMYAQRGAAVSSRITHTYDAKNESELEYIELLFGTPTQILRKDRQVYIIFPDARAVQMERLSRSDRFPGILVASYLSETAQEKNLSNALLLEIKKHYQVVNTGEFERVANRACEVVKLQPVTPDRYSYELCVDTQTRLLLSVQTFDLHKNLVEQTAFASINVGGQNLFRTPMGGKIPSSDQDVIDHLLKDQTLIPLSGHKSASDLGDIRRYQFDELAKKYGFHVIHQEWINVDDEKPEVLQSVLTDGIASVSIFAERMSEAEAKHAIAAARAGNVGLVNVFKNGIMLVGVGEVPVELLNQLVNAVAIK